MAQAGQEMVRYADDYVVLCESKEEAEGVLEILRQWAGAAGLTLHPAKTRIVDASQKGGFDFLGYHFERGYRWPRQKSLDKFKQTLREKTRSGRPGSLKDIIQEINRSVRGWFEYFKHSQNTVFKPLDGWIRQRLRRLLRRRRTGSSRGHSRSSTLARSLLRRSRANLLSLSPRQSEPTSAMRPLTGEPDAGNPPVRFGGRGEVLSLVPTPIAQRSLRDQAFGTSQKDPHACPTSPPGPLSYGIHPRDLSHRPFGTSVCDFPWRAIIPEGTMACENLPSV